MDTVRQRVVSALILRTEHGGKVKMCLTLRDRRSSYPNHWESPGGKVEQNETNHEALQRELREELGVNSCLIGATVGIVELDPPTTGKPLLLTLYHVYVSPDDPPEALQSRCLAYFEAEDLDDLPLTPGTKALCETIKTILRTRHIPMVTHELTS